MAYVCLLPLLSFVITASFSHSEFSAFELSLPSPPQNKIQLGISMIWNETNLWQEWKKTKNTKRKMKKTWSIQTHKSQAQYQS